MAIRSHLQAKWLFDSKTLRCKIVDEKCMRVWRVIEGLAIDQSFIQIKDDSFLTRMLRRFGKLRVRDVRIPE